MAIKQNNAKIAEISAQSKRNTEKLHLKKSWFSRLFAKKSKN